MTCKDCINYQKTQLKIYPNVGRPDVLFDCPFANDWCEYDTPINVLCDNKFEPKEKEMKRLEKIINTEELIELSKKWADRFIEKLSEEDINEMKTMYYNDEIRELSYDVFVDGFLCGAIQIRNIIEKELKKEQN